MIEAEINHPFFYKEREMHQFKNILYVSDTPKDQTEGLKQAISLAKNNQAKLTVLIICPEFPKQFKEHQQNFHDLLRNQMKQNIEITKKAIQKSDHPINITVDTLNNKTPNVAIIKYILTKGHDLVIKEPESKNIKSGFKAIDMGLLRKCPVPVWICQPIRVHSGDIRIAVAIDPESDEASAEQLSCQLLEVSRHLADFCNGELNIISCWDFTLEKELKENVFIKIDAKTVSKLLNEEKNEHFGKLGKLIQQSGITGENEVHHLRGEPSEVIPQFLEKHKIDILVMGTVARTGIAGFITGNTAENIMQNISCSLVALKPKGFVSPVKAH